MFLNLAHLRVQYTIRTDTHVSYLLPDNKHSVTIFFDPYTVSCYVHEAITARTIISFPISKRKVANWEDLVHAFCELAHKRFPAQVRHKSVSPVRQRHGF